MRPSLCCSSAALSCCIATATAAGADCFSCLPSLLPCDLPHPGAGVRASLRAPCFESLSIKTKCCELLIRRMLQTPQFLSYSIICRGENMLLEVAARTIGRTRVAHWQVLPYVPLRLPVAVVLTLSIRAYNASTESDMRHCNSHRGCCTANPHSSVQRPSFLRCSCYSLRLSHHGDQCLPVRQAFQVGVHLDCHCCSYSSSSQGSEEAEQPAQHAPQHRRVSGHVLEVVLARAAQQHAAEVAH